MADSQASLKRRIDQVREYLTVLEDGLNDKPQLLNAEAGRSAVRVLEASVGIQCITLTQIKKQKRKLRRGAKVLFYRYYLAPISAQVAMYDLHTQTEPVEANIADAKTKK